MSERRVAITGLGVICSLGLSAEQFWTALLEGRSGIGPITSFDASGMTCRIAGEARDFDPAATFGKKELRRLDRVAQLAAAAAGGAIEDSGLDLGSIDLDRAGVILGTGIGGLHEIEEQHDKLRDRGPDRVSPFFVPKMMSNAISGDVSIRHGLRGPNWVTSSACASAGHAVGTALRLIRWGEADVVVSGGSEATVSPLGMAGFCQARALSTRNDEPARASRPFDADRDGFVMGEGAGIVVLEEMEFARARGACIYAELLGVSWTGDAHHITAPDPSGSGAARAVTRSLADGRVDPSDVDYVNAHGTSTAEGDKAETRALRLAFGDHAERLAISSTKSMVGHLLGAAGGIELVATAKSVQTDRVHATINLETPDPECDLDYVPGAAREMPVRVAVCNSFGFGGHNVAMVVGKPRD